MVWNELKTSVRDLKPTSKVDLIQKIGLFWSSKLTPEKCRKYIAHMPKVLPHVILENGYSTAF